MARLAGRCVPGDSPVPYRPLTEAFAAAFRGPSPPRDPPLAGFGVHLGRLVPHWRDDGAGGTDESPVLLAEAVVRLAHLAAGDGDATLLLLEDLHWADVETLGGRRLPRRHAPRPSRSSACARRDPRGGPSRP